MTSGRVSSFPFSPFLSHSTSSPLCPSFALLPLEVSPGEVPLAAFRSAPSAGRAARARPAAHARARTHTPTLTGPHQTARRAGVCFLRRPAPTGTLLAGQWAPVSVLLAPVLYDAGNSISSRCWKINWDRAFPSLLRIRTHPGKPELPERGRSGRNRHPRVLSRPPPSRSAPPPVLPRAETRRAEQ